MKQHLVTLIMCFLVTILSACNLNEESIDVDFYAIHHTSILSYIVEEEFTQSVYDSETYDLRFKKTNEAFIIDTYADYVESTPGTALDNIRDDFYGPNFFDDNQIIVIPYFSKLSPAFKLSSYSFQDETINIIIETTPRIIREIYNEWDTTYTLVVEVMSKKIHKFNYQIFEKQTPLKHYISNNSQDVLAPIDSRFIFTDFDMYQNEINDIYQISETSFYYGFELPNEETFDDWDVFIFVYDKNHSDVLELEDVYIRYDFDMEIFTVEYILKPITGASPGVSVKKMSIVLFPKNIYVEGMDVNVVVYQRMNDIS